MRTVTLFLLWAISSSAANAARILAIVPTPSYSHQIAFRPLWKELLRRGHHVVVLTTDPIKDPTLTNLTEVDLQSSYDHVLGKYDIDEIITKNKNNPLLFMRAWIKFTTEQTDYVLSHPEVHNIIRNKDERFDLVMAEMPFPAMLAFSERFDCPSILIASMEATSVFHNLMGNPIHPVVYPDVMLPFDKTLSFKERVISTLFVVFREYMFEQVQLEIYQGFTKRYFRENRKTIRDLLGEVSMLFTNDNPILSINRPLGPNTISFGGGNHLSLFGQQHLTEV